MPATAVVVSGTLYARCVRGHDTECKPHRFARANTPKGKTVWEVPDDCPKCGGMIVATWRAAIKAPLIDIAS
jgi:NAD-dependent dihydropyrimidine dehydrogenase PreA subunit